jgi:uncharacterized protein YfaS (alpha-2-macroglobulin family)
VASTTLEGTITRAGAPLPRAYVQLLDRNGEFTGERRTEADGAYRFHIAPGSWVVVVFAATGSRAERRVELSEGDAARLDVELV